MAAAAAKVVSLIDDDDAAADTEMTGASADSTPAPAAAKAAKAAAVVLLVSAKLMAGQVVLRASRRVPRRQVARLSAAHSTPASRAAHTAPCPPDAVAPGVAAPGCLSAPAQQGFPPSEQRAACCGLSAHKRGGPARAHLHPAAVLRQSPPAAQADRLGRAVPRMWCPACRGVRHPSPSLCCVSPAGLRASPQDDDDEDEDEDEDDYLLPAFASTSK